MKNPYDFKKLIIPVMGFVTVLYTSFGTVSFLAHGSMTSESALFDVPLNHPSYIFVPFFYGVALILSFPI